MSEFWFGKLYQVMVKYGIIKPIRRVYMGNNMRLKYIEIDKIKVCPNQTRSFFEPVSLQGLADSVRRYGIIEPVCVRRVRGKYELISGERRIRAARMAGLRKVPAIVRFIKNDSVLPSVMLGNIGRQNISIFDEGQAFKKIVERSIITRAQLAARIGTSEESILAKVQALNLTEKARRIVTAYNLTEWHVVEAMRIKDKTRQEEILKIAGEGRLSPDKIRRMITGEENDNEEIPMRKHVVKNEKIYINTIRNTVSMMNEAGGVARTTEKEDDEFIRFTIEIKK